MGGTWYTSDPHFAHKRVAHIRGFETVEDHDIALDAQWRSQVRDEDTVYVLGDIGINFEHGLAWVSQLPGRKHLIAGNHDNVHPMHRTRYAHYFRMALHTFDTIQPFQRRRISGLDVALSHFPYASWGDGPGRPGSRYNEWRLPDMGMPLLHGHTHGQERAHGHQLHVGWDAWGRLVNEGEVAEWVKGLA